MNTRTVVLACLGLSIGAALVVSSLATGSDGQEMERKLRAVIDARIGSLSRDNEELRTRIGKLQEALEAARPNVRRASEPVAEERIAEAVARWMEANAPDEAVDAAASSPGDDVDAAVAFERLRAMELWSDEAQKLFDRAAASGRLDEIVARFEALAAANPDDPGAHVAYGTALIQKLQRGASLAERGVLAMKADAAFDEALDIDPEHWSARFTKAMSYTFWPPVMGKQPEAIGHFETLLEQQEQHSPQPRYARTYLYLGNLYQQRGDADKAREIWQRGLGLYPENGELRGKLGQ